MTSRPEIRSSLFFSWDFREAISFLKEAMISSVWLFVSILCLIIEAKIREAFYFGKRSAIPRKFIAKMFFSL